MARRWPLVVVASCLGLTLSACGGSSSAASDTIHLGATNAVSGAIGAVCNPVTDGAKAWFDAVNARGGVHGQKIDYTVLDDRYDAARAASNVRKLANNDVLALVTGCGTANERAAQELAQQREIPQIGLYSNLAQYLNPPRSTYFGLFPPYGVQDAAAITTGIKHSGPGTVLHISQKEPRYDADNALAKAATQKSGGKWIGTIPVVPTTTDYTPLALKVRAKNPDYILITTGDSQAAQIFRALQAKGVDPAKGYLATFATTQTLLSTAGNALEENFLGVSSVKLQGDDIQSCVKAIKKHGSPADNNLHGYFGCSVAQVVTAALKNINGKITTQSLVAALNSLHEESSAPALGPVSFSKSDHAGVTVGAVYAIKGGKYVESGSVRYRSP